MVIRILRYKRNAKTSMVGQCYGEKGVCPMRTEKNFHMTLLEFALVSENAIKKFCLVGGEDGTFFGPGDHHPPMYAWWGGSSPPMYAWWEDLNPP